MLLNIPKIGRAEGKAPHLGDSAPIRFFSFDLPAWRKSQPRVKEAEGFPGWSCPGSRCARPPRSLCEQQSPWPKRAAAVLL